MEKPILSFGAEIILVPESCLKKSRIIFIKTDFPSPEGPTIPRISPPFTERLILSKTFFLPNDFEMLLREITSISIKMFFSLYFYWWV